MNGAAPEPVPGVASPHIRPHDGVAVGHDQVHDSATRTVIYGPADPVDLLAEGLASVVHSRRTRWALAGAAVRSPCRRPWRALALGFRRRHPGGSAAAALVAVVAASRLPAAAMLLLFGLPATALGAVFGDLPLLWGVAAAATATCWASMVGHELAHLLTLRWLEGDRGVGAIAHSFTAVWVVAPRLAASHRRAVAFAGPAAGIAACAAAGLLGVPGWIWLAAAGLHLASLWPSAPDGQAIFGQDGTTDRYRLVGLHRARDQRRNRGR